jgi:predicted Zn-dependent protease
MVEAFNRLKNIAIIFIIGVWSICSAPISVAAEADMVLISDTETQDYLAGVVKPLYNAAGLTFDKNHLLIVRDNSLNAFVSDGNYMFVHTGTILAADDTNELAGILAHETGHIMGGHIVRQKLKLEKMQYVLLGSMIAAGATAVSTGRGDAAMAVILGSQSSMINHMLHHQIQEERAADESAVILLDKTKQSTAGLLRFMQKIQKHNLQSGISETDYFSNHPLTSERISHFTEVGKHNHYPAKSSLDAKFALVQAKLSGYLEDAARVWRRYPKEGASAAAKYAHSILYFRQSKLSQAYKLVDELIAEHPNNPYFYELKGQFLFENGRVKESVSAYEKALALLPEAPNLQFSLAHALLESSEDKAVAKRAIMLLQKAQLKQPMTEGWLLLSRAYDTIGNRSASLYAAAEFSYDIGNLPAAEKQLEQAGKTATDKALKLKISDLSERVKEEIKEMEEIF